MSDRGTPQETLDDEATRTLRAEEATGEAGGSSTPPSSAGPKDSLDGARFAPGAILAGRYRLVAMLGRGGMGEVYRAEDLKLGEPVAVKFLPEELTFDGAALARFHREVRVARQIAHRNVCRVHDIGEAEGFHFLTMEYIDGEDLASLLRRIGRLPQDKAVELSGQICRGLAAAHDAGVLHRDLKPANIMIDGKGRAKITDFGLANLQDELRDSDQDHFAGTPTYMAPEQLQGGELTARSDIYALGLVLYEMFTGEKAFADEDWRRLVARGGRDAPPAEPSSHVEGLDPQIERALLRCLEEDPKHRPRSALEVAAALPGGDPLRAALEAGETPSPEMVAGVTDRGPLLSIRAGAVWLTAFIVLLLSFQFTAKRTTLIGQTALEKRPEALDDRALTLLSELGWDAVAPERVDRFGAFQREDRRFTEFHGESMAAWDQRSRERPAFITYFHRTAAGRPLVMPELGRPTAELPPAEPGDTLVVFDPAGRLERLRLDAPGLAPAGQPDWSRVFDWAQLDVGALERLEAPAPDGSVDLPIHDARAAWTGRLDGREVHVDTASFGSLPVYFRLSTPTSGAEPTRPSDYKSPAPLVVGFVAVLCVAVFAAARNVRRGRGDVRGALTLGAVSAGCHVVAQAIFRHHGFGEAVVNSVLSILAGAAFRGVVLIVLYLAMEPAVRSRAPELIISWTRLLRGNWRDPLVARDALVGLTVGLGLMTFYTNVRHLWDPTPWVIFGMGEKLSGISGAVGMVESVLFLEWAGLLTLALVYAHLLHWIKRKFLAGAILTLLAGLLSGNPDAALVIVPVLSVAGVVASWFSWVAADAIAFYPATADPSQWWAWPNAWLLSILLLIVAILAFRNATGLGSATPSRGGPR